MQSEGGSEAEDDGVKKHKQYAKFQGSPPIDLDPNIEEDHPPSPLTTLIEEEVPTPFSWLKVHSGYGFGKH